MTDRRATVPPIVETVYLLRTKSCARYLDLIAFYYNKQRLYAFYYDKHRVDPFQDKQRLVAFHDNYTLVCTA